MRASLASMASHQTCSSRIVMLPRLRYRARRRYPDLAVRVRELRVLERLVARIGVAVGWLQWHSFRRFQNLPNALRELGRFEGFAEEETICDGNPVIAAYLGTYVTRHK